jgi:hypothetical protein
MPDASFPRQRLHDDGEAARRGSIPEGLEHRVESHFNLRHPKVGSEAHRDVGSSVFERLTIGTGP